MYSRISASGKANYTLLKETMGRCLDPCDSDNWNWVSFSSWRRIHDETVQEFGIAPRRLAAKAYCSVAKGHFIAHVGNGDLHVSL